MKKCLICSAELNEYNWSSWSAKNHINKCKTCLRVEKNEWLAKKRAGLSDHEKLAARERGLKHKIKLKESNPEKYTAIQMAASCRKRAKYLFVDCDIDSKYIRELMPEFCPILNVRLKYGGGDKSPHSASLDRIDSSKGYIKGNVQIISARANMMKSDADAQEMLMFAEWVMRSFEKTKDVQTDRTEKR